MLSEDDPAERRASRIVEWAIFWRFVGAKALLKLTVEERMRIAKEANRLFGRELDKIDIKDRKSIMQATKEMPKTIQEIQYHIKHPGDTDSACAICGPK
jgi:hypothetical protein